MRIKSISAKNVSPVNYFAVDNLSDIVVLAGPNGVGKSRLIQHLINVFQSPRSYPNTKIVLEASDLAEEKLWGKKLIDTSNPTDANILVSALHRNQKRVNWKNSILNFESDRSIQQLNPYQFSWDYVDSYQEEVGWNTTLGYMRDRFQDTLHAILKKIEFQKRSIANRAIALRKQGKTQMTLEFEDPMIPFKDVFSQLLSPKKGCVPDLCGFLR